MTAPSRQLLARTITDQAQVQAMPDDALPAAIAAHEAEIVALEGRINAASDPTTTQPAQRALTILKLHLRWLERERNVRDRKGSLTERQQRRQAADRQQQMAIGAKRERIAIANNANTRSIEVFKEVAREVLGAEMYGYLWELARQRAEAKETNT